MPMVQAPSGYGTDSRVFKNEDLAVSPHDVRGASDQLPATAAHGLRGFRPATSARVHSAPQDMEALYGVPGSPAAVAPYAAPGSIQMQPSAPPLPHI